MKYKMLTNLGTDLQVHLVSFHLLRSVVVVQSRLVHLILALHLKPLAAQRAEHDVRGELSVHIGARQSLYFVEDVGVDHGIEVLQSVEIS